jgi:hypothetical protein
VLHKTKSVDCGRPIFRLVQIRVDLSRMQALKSYFWSLTKHTTSYTASANPWIFLCPLWSHLKYEENSLKTKPRDLNTTSWRIITLNKWSKLGLFAIARTIGCTYDFGRKFLAKLSSKRDHHGPITILKTEWPHAFRLSTWSKDRPRRLPLT